MLDAQLSPDTADIRAPAPTPSDVTTPSLPLGDTEELLTKLRMSYCGLNVVERLFEKRGSLDMYVLYA